MADFPDIVKDFIRQTGVDEAEFDERLKAFDPAAAVIFAANRLVLAIDLAAANIIRDREPET